MSAIELKSFLKQSIDHLPENVLWELKAWVVKIMEVNKPAPVKRQRQAGCLQGFFSYVAPDFNAPLEDLKEYMY